MKSTHKEIIRFFLISFGTYLIFHAQYLFGDLIPNRGDAISLHYPATYYLEEKLREGLLPFWTERLYLGFPAYANGEFAYLNPLHVLTTFIFGFYKALKIEHLILYLLGSWGLYKLLKDKKVPLAGYTIANVCYFFSFFQLLRLAMHNLVAVTLLFPLNIYLIEKYFEEKKEKYIIANALLMALGFYYGHLHALVISFLGQFILLTARFNPACAGRPAKTLRYSLSFTVLFSALILPQLIPTYQVYKQGSRENIGVNFTDGSITPFLSTTTLYPFLLGKDETYIGQQVNNNYIDFEIYNYAGIAALLLAAIGILKSQNTKFEKFLYCLILTFLFFGFLKHIPLIEKVNPSIIDKFRYWIRTFFLANFALAIFAAYAIRDRNKKIVPKNIIYLVLPIIYLLSLELVSGITYDTKVIVNHLLHGGFSKDTNFWVWAILVAATLSLVVLKSKGRSINYALCVLVSLDLTFFGAQATKKLFINKNELILGNVKSTTETLKNNRVLIENPQVTGNRYLYYPIWGMFGYIPPYESQVYKEYINDLGFSNARRMRNEDKTREGAVIPALEAVLPQLGFTAILDPQNNIRSLPQQNLDLIQNENIQGAYIKKEEGILAMSLETEANTQIATLIRNYPGWELKIDNKRGNLISSPKDVFLKFELPQGNHVVELKYKPTWLYQGLIAGAGLLAIYGLIQIWGRGGCFRE